MKDLEVLKNCIENEVKLKLDWKVESRTDSNQNQNQNQILELIKKKKN